MAVVLPNDRAVAKNVEIRKSSCLFKHQMVKKKDLHIDFENREKFTVLKS